MLVYSTARVALAARGDRSRDGAERCAATREWIRQRGSHFVDPAFHLVLGAADAPPPSEQVRRGPPPVRAEITCVEKLNTSDLCATLRSCSSWSARRRLCSRRSCSRSGTSAESCP